MGFVDQWQDIVSAFSEDWSDARLRLRLEDAEDADRAAALLAPLNPGRGRGEVVFYTARRGAGPLPDLVRRHLARLDRERIRGSLEVVSSGRAEPERAIQRSTLVSEWDALLDRLPPDWSDLYLELELTSTDYLERAALLTAPVNPARYSGRPGFRFRCARRFGYGASPGMVRRCLERLDAEAIRGELRLLRALADTEPVATQGPVWRVGGRSV